MKPPILILDCTGLCHRAWHALPPLSYKDQETQVIMGILKDIHILQEMWNTKHIFFCFDDGISLRTKVYPSYKANRSREGKQSLYSQIELLKHKVLKSIGFNNVFFANGYEADDWLGFLTGETYWNKPVVLVTRDHDMYQLLTETKSVVAYDPQTKSTYTFEDFVRDWNGLEPHLFPKIKALMGDKGDNIAGVQGVGIETAIRIVKNEPVSKNIQTRLDEFYANGRLDLNLKLVTLPWPGLEKHHQWKRTDDVTKEKWINVCEEYGLDSLVANCPRGS